MKAKELVIKQLDLLVEMAEHCTNKETHNHTIKCPDCALSWNFRINNHGCFLVEIINNDKLFEDLESVCRYHNIDYQDKFNKIASIIDTECDE